MNSIVSLCYLLHACMGKIQSIGHEPVQGFLAVRAAGECKESTPPETSPSSPVMGLIFVLFWPQLLSFLFMWVDI